MRARIEDQVRADLRNYGHVVDRRAALSELHPPLRVVIAEATDPGREAQIAEYAARKRKRDRERARRMSGPQALKGAA